MVPPTAKTQMASALRRAQRLPVEETGDSAAVAVRRYLGVPPLAADDRHNVDDAAQTTENRASR